MKIYELLEEMDNYEVKDIKVIVNENELGFMLTSSSNNINLTSCVAKHDKFSRELFRGILSNMQIYYDDMVVLINGKIVKETIYDPDKKRLFLVRQETLFLPKEKYVSFELLRPYVSVDEFVETNGFEKISLDSDELFKYNYNLINKIYDLNFSPYSCYNFYVKDGIYYGFNSWGDKSINFIDLTEIIKKE